MRVVQIGLGQWGKNHYRILKEIGVLAAVCDTDPDKMEVTRDDGIATYSDLHKMIDEVKPDAAIVTTPTSTHFHVAHKLLLSGINVFIEKPFTQSVNDGDVLIKLAREKGLKLTCGYIERFNPVTQYIMNLGKTPNLLEFHRESAIPAHIKDAGIVMDTAVHDIETACYLFQRYPDGITAITKNIQGNKGLEDMATISLDFGTAVANIVANWNTKIKMRLIHATYDDFVVRGDFVEKTVEVIYPDGTSKKVRHYESDPLEMELQSFLNCVEHDYLQPEVDAVHANRITGIANDILSVSKEGV